MTEWCCTYCVLSTATNNWY